MMREYASDFWSHQRSVLNRRSDSQTVTAATLRDTARETRKFVTSVPTIRSDAAEVAAGVRQMSYGIC